MKLHFKILLLLLILSVNPVSVFANSDDNLFRGFGVNALTVDGADDLAILQNHVTENNVNAFRIQYFYTEVDENYENDEDQGSEKYLDWVENTVLPHFAWLKAGLDDYGVQLILCLHTPVGGRQVSNPPIDRVFLSDELMDTQILAWTMIAEVYNGSSNVDYQIFSEPAVDNNDTWREFYTDLIEDISDVSNQSISERQKIILMPRYGNPNLVRGVQFDGLPDTFEYVLGVNIYAPFEYTHQGTAAVEDRDAEFSYPADLDIRSCERQQNRITRITEKIQNLKTKRRNLKRKRKRKVRKRIRRLRKRLRRFERKLKKCEKGQKRDAKSAGEYHKVGLEKAIKKAINKSSKENVLLWIMEYAAVTYADGAELYLRDLGEVFDENDISSFYHILFEAGVWDPLKDCNRETQTCEVVNSSNRMDALIKYFSSNQFPSS